MPVVLVTGAHGFIGRHLAACLASQDNTVIGIGHGEWREAEFKLHGLTAWLDSDLSCESIDKLKAEWGIPDAIYHLAGGSSVGAALADPREDFVRTVDSTSVLLEWIRKQATATPLVSVSSAAVYGAGHNGKISEAAECNPYSPYGSHKLMMEILCRSYADNYGLKIVIPRLFSVYGDGLRKQLLWDLCNRLASEDPVELGGSGEELRDWTHIGDVVKGLCQAARMADDRASVFNLSSGIATSVSSIATLVARHWGGNAAADRLHFSGSARSGDPFSLVADIGEMSSRGIECKKALTEGVAEYVDWFREQINSTP